MALRRSLQLLPRLAGMAGETAAPCAAFQCRTPSSSAQQSHEARSPYANALAHWREYSSGVQIVPNNPAVGAIAQTPTGLPPTVHARANPTHLITYDEKNQGRLPIGDPNKRAFTYFVLTGARFMYASAIRLVVLKFILSWAASQDVLAMAALEVDLTSIKAGNCATVKWRGKPVFVKHRTPDEIARERAVDLSQLRDPQTDEERCINPDWMVCLGVCTHLGCVPVANAGDYHGWFCPCHGSHYDGSGRARRGPAPYNLEIPQYKFLDDDTLLIG